MTLSILFFLGFFAPPEPVASATHALLLYDTAAIADHSPRSLAKEYGEWAQSLAQRGALITAQELGAEERWVGADAESRSFPTPTGVFLVSASSLAEAIDLTEQSPHARHGGWIQVRPIIAHQ